MTEYPHISVLLDEVINSFQPVHIETFVDGTLGAGGHSLAILEAHPEIKTLIGFDQDQEALLIAKKRLEKWHNKVEFVKANFSEMKKRLKSLKFEKVDGILLDLGVSSMQLDQAEKGFSFSKEGPLDMRMDSDNPLTAKEIVNEWDEKELGKIFREYGEEKQWKLAARVIVKRRSEKPFTTTKELADCLIPALRFYAKKGINPATLIFQALRIAVNKELEVLDHILKEAIALLSPGGRLAIITFHSLEDSRVKNHFRFCADDKYDTSGIGGVFADKEREVKIITKKPIVAEEQEIAQNSRSRSAKLRVVEKL